MNLAPVVTFAVYVLISLNFTGGTLLTAQAFTSIALVSLLTQPVIVFIQVLPMVVQCIGSFDRIQEYCNYAATSTTEGDDTQVTRGSPSSQMKESNGIILDTQNFSWNKSSAPVLKNITVQIEPRRIVALVGQVGSGKTAFLNCLLGEMVSVPDTSAVRPIGPASVAYCPQEPWLENGTIRQNILGTFQYDEKRYELAISACALEHDLARLPRGDQTSVGTRGINLSGGQKQRVVSDSLSKTS
jgi:ATP-binding cassette, subfamily C (CFTR/MRP), member 1